MVIEFISFILGMLVMAILRRLTVKDAESLVRNLNKTIQRHAEKRYNRVLRTDAKEVVDEIQDKIEAWIIRQEGV